MTQEAKRMIEQVKKGLYEQAIVKCCGTMLSYSLFDRSTVIAVIFDKDKQKVLDDLVKTRNKYMAQVRKEIKRGEE